MTLRILTTLACTAAIGLPSVAAAAAPAPLSDEDRALFWGSAQDDAPEVLNARLKHLEGRHYLKGDEWNIHLYYPHIKDLGGGYMGVGTDQAYFFIGWQRPELAWLTDYDPWVVALHQAYREIFEAAETHEAFLRFWSGKSKLEAKADAFLEDKLAEHPNKALIIKVFKKARPWVRTRLVRMKYSLMKAKVPSFITDADTYTYVRDLVVAERVRPMLCNLLDKEGLKGVAVVAKKLGVPMRVSYLSNAEEYWKYGDQFRANITGMHYDAKSLILRTTAAKLSNKDYRYHYQPAENFVAWLRQPYTTSFKQVTHWTYIKHDKHFPLRKFDRPPAPPKPKKGSKKSASKG